MSFLKNASKSVTDVRGFLRDAASGSSIKYAAEKGAKHLVYIPYNLVNDVDEAGNIIGNHKEPIAISGAVHEWQTPDGKFKACVCLKDVIRKDDNGELLNDGTCPLCDRVADAWDIYNYRKDVEEANCKLTGEARKTHMEKTLGTFADERKAKAARMYMYLLIVKFRVDAMGNPVMGSDGLPEYDLKVMKLSNSRVEKIQQQLSNSGSELPGSELIFEYPATDDKRLQVSQSTTAPVFPNNMLTARYPALVEKINQDVSKFEFDEIEKSFPEWAGMTTVSAKAATDALFEKWDQYRLEVKANPGAKYLEYITTTPVSQPSLGGLGAPVIPGAAVPGAPVIPGVAQPTIPQAAEAPVIPGVAPQVAPQAAQAPQEAPTAPQAAPGQDVNSVFGGSGISI